MAAQSVQNSQLHADEYVIQLGYKDAQKVNCRHNSEEYLCDGEAQIFAETIEAVAYMNLRINISTSEEPVFIDEVLNEGQLPLPKGRGLPVADARASAHID